MIRPTKLYEHPTTSYIHASLFILFYWPAKFFIIWDLWWRKIPICYSLTGLTCVLSVIIGFDKTFIPYFSLFLWAQSFIRTSRLKLVWNFPKTTKNSIIIYGTLLMYHEAFWKYAFGAGVGWEFETIRVKIKKIRTSAKFDWFLYIWKKTWITLIIHHVMYPSHWFFNWFF